MASNTPPPQWQKGDLWDTDPNTFVAREAIKRLDLTQCYLTDDAIMKLLINKRERTISGMNIFRFNEVEFIKNGFLRSRHKGKGAPALAPDGTVMTVMAGAHHNSIVVLNGGNSNLPAGSWSIENYQAKSDHPRYEEWLSKIKWTNVEALRAGISPTSINSTLTSPPKRAQQNINKPEENKGNLREKKEDSPYPNAEKLRNQPQPDNAEKFNNEVQEPIAASRPPIPQEGQERVATTRSATPHEAPVEETPSEYATLSSTYSEITTSKPATPEPSRPEAIDSQVADFMRAVSDLTTPNVATPKPIIAESGTSESNTLRPVITQPMTPDRAVSEPASPKPVSAEPATSEQVLVQPVTPNRSVSEPPATSDITSSEPTVSERSKAADSKATGLGVAGSGIVGSEAVGWRVANSEATGSRIAGSEVVAATSELATSKPIDSKSTVSEVAASQPVALKAVSSEPPASEFTVSERVSLETSASEPAPTEPTAESEASNLITSEVAGLETVALKPAASEPTPEPASEPTPLKSFASISMQAKISSPKQFPLTSTPRNINTFLFQPDAQGPINANMIQSQPPASVRQNSPSPGPTLMGTRPESTVGLGIHTGLMQQTTPKTSASMFRQQLTPRQPSLEIRETPPPTIHHTVHSEAHMPRERTTLISSEANRMVHNHATTSMERYNLRHPPTTQSVSVTSQTSIFQSPPATPASNGSLKRKATEPLDRLVTFYVGDGNPADMETFNFSELKLKEKAPGFYELFDGKGRRAMKINGHVYDVDEKPRLFEAMLHWIDKGKVMPKYHSAPNDLECYYVELYLAAVSYTLPGLSNAVIDKFYDWHRSGTVRFQKIDRVYSMTQPGDGLRKFYFGCMMALSVEEFEVTPITAPDVMVDLFAVKRAAWNGMEAKEAYHNA